MDNKNKLICKDCIHRDYFDDGAYGCSHPYLYNKNGDLIEARNNKIATNMAKNQCDKKEVKQGK